ncbi:MAG TPA: ElyC/SanA/YdcF family protein [Bellilinea sp.]|jgi:SanA protein|nr:ElyC/SanA/YdcF family protein [Bellilinea sp.]
MKKLRPITRILPPLAIGASLFLILPTLVAGVYSQSLIRSVDSVEPAPVAIVFGAGLTRSGEPTPVLRDRVQTAADLYFAGKVEKLLMSGDNRTLDYNEPGAMRDYAIGLGVPEEDIILDYAGRRTYDTCYRARHIFGVEQAILVTQNFHLPRALFTCSAFGIQSSGVSADLRTYSRRSMEFWQIREVAATSQAFIDVYLTRPLPVLGDPEPIFPNTAHSISNTERVLAP